MSIASGQVIYGLSAQATPIGTNVAGTLTIGVSQTARQLTTVNSAYSMKVAICSNGAALAIDHLTCDTTGTTTFVAGAAQVEQATCVGTITQAGNAEVIVTATGMTGSPKTIAVAVALNDTAAQWATKVRAALAADSAVSSLFTVSGATDKVILTPLQNPAYSTFPVPIYTANDAALNINLNNGTCTGITPDATSDNITAGVATTGVKLWDADGKDFEGESLATMTAIRGVMIEGSFGSVTYSNSGDNCNGVIEPSGIAEYGNWATSGTCPYPDSYTATVPSVCIVTILGETA